ncbi:hypothetical protein XELAEV_18002416mg [Xenopus laevis]|nr:hypothetical protein XELAEV_18002416mg [Xenopus laevis]
MMILPKFLYLFRMLPIHIPLRFIKDTQRLINKFVWLNIKQRVQASVLYRRNQDGGLPNISLSCKAAIWSQTLTWNNITPSNRWQQLEQYYSSPVRNLSHILWSQPSRNLAAMDGLLTSTTPFPTPWASIRILELSIPGLNLSSWEAKGITIISQLNDTNQLKSSDLSSRYDLSCKEFYKYLQIRYLLQSTSKEASRQTTEMKTILLRPTVTIKGISRINILLRAMLTDHLT